MQRKIISILLTGMLVILVSLSLNAQTYTVKKWVIGSGGIVGAVNGSGDEMSGVNGQLAIGRRLLTNGRDDQGFWVEDYISDVPAIPQDDGKQLSNYPNPFNTTTHVRYQLQGPSFVTIKIYDMMGNTVKTLAQGSLQDAGMNELLWDGKNDNGVEVGSGSYLYELSATPAAASGSEGFVSFKLHNIMIVVK